jgi:asparagine synthase (glutamine-hydrolysing)
MCGIAGIIDLQEKLSVKTSIESMKSAIKHRGPDDHGTSLDEDLGLALGHQRLSILDVQKGKQPFTSLDGQIVLVFNGEIYNYLELRRDLISKKHPLMSHSDTEVIIYAYKTWGVDCLLYLRGMFAFSLWDKEKKILFCARDRLGIKPFYYFFNKQKFVFSSEIKGIFASNRVDAELNPVGLEDYLTFQFCLGQQTLFKNIKKIEPGYYLIVSYQAQALSMTYKQYWEINYTSYDLVSTPYYIEKLSGLLKESVRLHLQADVPLGAYLSGGLDSSSVVCLASHTLKEKNLFKTFTGVFSVGEQYNESVYARAVASHVESEHHEIVISDVNLAETLPSLIYFMDEPAAGPGLISQYAVSKFAAKHVKVVLGGQGGDELFIGYARYLIAYLENCLANTISGKSISKGMSLAAIAKNLVLLDNYKPMLKNFFGRRLFEAEDVCYFHLMDKKNTEDGIYCKDVYENSSCFSRFQMLFNRSEHYSLLNKMLYFDLKSSLPALLQVEDRMSMAASLESRVPLLDHRLVEFSASIPDNIKFSAGKTKHIFRKAVKNFIPLNILNRKDKMGFPVPLTEWFYGKQHSFVSDVLFSKKSKERGLVDITKLKKIFKNKAPISRSIWGALCLELWFMRFID